MKRPPQRKTNANIFFGVLSAVFILTAFLVRPWGIGDPSHEGNEPLADPRVLSQLMEGKDTAQPPPEEYAEFHDTRVVPPPIAIPYPVPLPRAPVLGVSSEEKRIEVDLTNQRVYLFEGSRKVNEFVVSTGKWAPTPTGEFRIWTKIRSQKMSGGSQERHTYYYLPNVPYIMFFYNEDISKYRGFSLHGAYWHNNFGHPMSHGCVNMKIEDAKAVYEWANPQIINPKKWSVLATEENPGTRVVIYGETPKS